MRSNDVLQNGQLGAGKRTDNATPRLFLVRHTPRILCRRDGEATLRHVEAYLLSRLKAARRLALPGFVRWYAIGYHSLLIARVLRQKGNQP